MRTRNALIAGASGLVGSELIKLLINDSTYREIHSLVRTPGRLQNPKLIETVIDFENLDELIPDIKIDDVFCALGTTMNKAGSKEAFYRVDYHYVVGLARLAIKIGARSFLVVSSLGANSNSRFFYNRVKGEMEEAIKELPFKTIYIFQPSVLGGERNERRWGEMAAAGLLKLLAPVMVGGLRKYRVTEAKHLAWAMLRTAKECPAGINVVQADTISSLLYMK